MPDSFEDFYLEELMEETVPVEETEAVEETVAETEAVEETAEATEAAEIELQSEETEEVVEETTAPVETALQKGLTLSPNEVYKLDPLVYPALSWNELLEFTSSRPSVARIVNNKIVAVNSGKAVIKVRDPETNKSITFPVTVLSEGDEGYRRYDKPVADVFELVGYTTQKAYYMLSSEDKEIGDTGDLRFFNGGYSLSMYPSESVMLNYKLDAYFPNETTVVFETSNDNIVTINEFGVVTAVAEGFASVTMKVMQNDRSTYYSETVSVEVKDPFVTSGAQLTHYYGKGGLVVFPEDLSITEIGNFAFANFEYIEKTPEEMAFDDVETSKQWFIGDNSITKVIIPEGVEKIGSYAFANLTALEEIVFPSTLQAIEYGAFYNCVSLEKITFSGENHLQIINQNAFENCDLQGIIDLSAACVISDYAFAGNVDLEGFVTSEDLLSIGQYAFAGCKKLKDVTIGAAKVKYGAYAFTGCESLEAFEVNAAVIPEGMFYEAENLTTVVVGADVNDIGEFAFRDTKVDTFDVVSGNKAFKNQKAAYILSADGSTVVAVSPTFRGEFNAEQLGGAKVTAIANGAFSHNTRITSVELPEVTVIGDYGFGSSEGLAAVKLGDLTKVGEYAFFETALTELPSFTAETEIGKYAFAFTDLVNVTIPDNMVIEEGVFSECLKLETVVIGNDVTIGDYAFNVSVNNAYTIESYTEEIEVVGSVAVPDEDAHTPAEDVAQDAEHESAIEEVEQTYKAVEEEKYFYYSFATALKNLTIGNNAVIGECAFFNAASLEAVTLGENAQIGKQAFYNNASLKEIDLSKAASIGDYAFSGDVYYVCVDDAMSYAAVSSDGHYIYTYHAPALESVELATATEFGEYCFAYCRELTEVVLNENITKIPAYAFAGCEKLISINLANIQEVGMYAFMEGYALESIDLSNVQTIGEYAFVNCNQLTGLVFGENAVKMDEGAFAYCESLETVGSTTALEDIGAYAFAYTAITDIDLTGAVNIGDQAFLKEELTPFHVELGEKIVTLGDNPFAMCALEPFAQTTVSNFNGTEHVEYNYNYNISDTVSVIDGSLYCRIANGLELIAFAGPEHQNVKVAEDTVRITAHAFAGSDVEMVTLPHTVAAIGHKAFYQCDRLHTVIFNSYDAPILEEEFDPSYYESYTHIPGSGNYGEYTDYDGTQVSIDGINLMPYYMWNATGGMYSNVFYGANFVDYVGYVQDKLTMVRPVNGKLYDSYIYGQYFDVVIDGAEAADAYAIAAIKAINNLPERVGYEHKAQVEAAREAYNKIATYEQMAQVYNYATLVSAEQRIIALTPEEDKVAVEGTAAETVETTDETTAPVVEEAEKPENNKGIGALVTILTVLVLVAAGMFFYMKKSYGAEAINHFKQMCGKALASVKKVCGNAVKAVKTKIADAKAASRAKKEAKADAAPKVEETAQEAPAAEEAPAEEEIPTVEVVEE